MVDLVTAGISSSSFWSYLASVVGDFDAEVKAAKGVAPLSKLLIYEVGAYLIY